MTKIRLRSGTDVYTEMTSTEVSQYLQSGVKTGRIKGWADEGKLQPIWIAVDGIDCIYIN